MACRACSSCQVMESGAMIDYRFDGVFAVFPTSDNDPYVVFGVSKSSCCRRYGFWAWCFAPMLYRARCKQKSAWRIRMAFCASRRVTSQQGASQQGASQKIALMLASGMVRGLALKSISIWLHGLLVGPRRCSRSGLGGRACGLKNVPHGTIARSKF